MERFVHLNNNSDESILKFKKIQISKYNRTHQVLNSEFSALIDIDNSVEVRLLTANKLKLTKIFIQRLPSIFTFYKAINIAKHLSEDDVQSFVIM
jgi:hypothetical protein